MWLLDPIIVAAMERAQKSGEYSARSGEDFSFGPDILSIDGQTAVIQIEGVLTAKPDFFAWFFGGGNTTYPAILSALTEAEGDDNVQDIRLSIDSPGGSIEGLFELLVAIDSVDKPVTAFVLGKALSAAFSVASQADSIVARDRASRLGAIGVIANFQIDENFVAITNTRSPKKNPDPTTEAGKKEIRAQIDSMHDLFVETIAEGRGVSSETVNSEFGKGSIFLADEAKARGMIDSIGGDNAPAPVKSVTKTAKAETTEEIQAMTNAELKAAHPEFHAEVFAQGIAQERERVQAHLVLGQASGDMETVIECIDSGSEVTSLVVAKHHARAMSGKDLKAFAEDGADADAGDTTAPDASTEDAEADQVATAIEGLFGVGETSNVK